MAQKLSVILIDDLNGEEAEGTVRFGLDGTSYEIDLSSTNSRELRDLLKPYIDGGRKVTGTAARRASTSRAPGSDGARNSAMRTWAKARGLKVNERGRVPAAVVSEYEAANGR